MAQLRIFAAGLFATLLFGSTWWAPSVKAQEVRETFNKVKSSVVVVRTLQKAAAPFPQEGTVLDVGLGSGVLISDDGKVLTAAHVVQSADQVLVEFLDGKLIPARVMNSEVYADVALLQLERTPAGAIAAKIGDSDKVDVGDEILVVGAPYGLRHTLTVGHISGRRISNDRMVSMRAMEFLQTDAAINTGNSGGPMFNLAGEVVGIVNTIMSRSGGFEGIGFATTSKLARELLLEKKIFWSGLEGVLIEGDLARALNLPQTAGFLVQRVAEGSPAWREGIRAGSLRARIEDEDLLLGGDVILEVNGIPVLEGHLAYERIYASMGKLKEGEKLTSKVLRDGKVIELCAMIRP
jgi:S1-C subfamily serine protease